MQGLSVASAFCAGMMRDAQLVRGLEDRAHCVTAATHIRLAVGPVQQ